MLWESFYFDVAVTMKKNSRDLKNKAVIEEINILPDLTVQLKYMHIIITDGLRHYAAGEIQLILLNYIWFMLSRLIL